MVYSKLMFNMKGDFQIFRIVVQFQSIVMNQNILMANGNASLLIQREVDRK